MHFSQVFIRSISFTPNINDSDVAILGVSRSQKQLPFTDGLVAELRKCVLSPSYRLRNRVIEQRSTPLQCV